MGLNFNYANFIDVPDNAQLRFTSGDSISLATWIRPNNSNSSGYGTIAIKGETAGINNANWAWRLGDGPGAEFRLTFFTVVSGTTNFQCWDPVNITSGQLFLSGIETHLALTYTFNDKQSIILYKDGAVIAAGDSGSTSGSWSVCGTSGSGNLPPTVNSGVMFFGAEIFANGGSVKNSLNAMLEDHRVYRRILSANEVATIYACDGHDGIVQDMAHRAFFGEAASGQQAPPLP